MLNFAAEKDIEHLKAEEAQNMSAELLVDAPEFMSRLEKEVLSAQDSVYVQAMSFEGDAAGKQLIDMLLKSPAKDRRLCIDSYSKAVINDQFVHSTAYLSSSSFRKEVAETKRIVKYAESEGIKVHFTNPVGWLMLKYPLRNHKKMVVVDEKISFIGGINFTDHNFEWHDFMIAMEHNEISKTLAEDFRHTWNGENQSCKYDIEDSEIYFLDGYRSVNTYKSLFAHLEGAKNEIQILSPYVSNPLLGFLEKHVDQDVEVRIITPAVNNKSIFKDHLLNELSKGYFSLYELQNTMSHLKAILIDGEKLIFGSSNFDFASYYLEQEVVVVTQNPIIVEEFRNKILIPDTKNSIRISPDTTPVRASNTYKVKLAEKACRGIGKLAYNRPKTNQI